MAGLEGAEAVEHDGFFGRSRPQGLVEQQAVAAEALDVALKRRVPDPGGASDLAQPRAVDDAPEDGFQELWRLQPIVDGEGL